MSNTFTVFRNKNQNIATTLFLKYTDRTQGGAQTKPVFLHTVHASLNKHTHTQPQGL